MTQVPGPEMLAAALKHAERGWRVFPCVAKTKRPCDEVGLFEHGCTSATKSPFWIKKYWNRWPGANPAVATGPETGLWVLDIDMKNGVDGFATLAVLEGLFGALPPTLSQHTPMDGMQRFFVWPPDRDVRNRNGKALGPGLDARGDGGYIMVPPSIHPDRLDGPRYRWETDPETRPAVHAPEWLIRYVIGDPEDLEWLRRQVDGKDLPPWVANRLKIMAPPPDAAPAVQAENQRALPADGIHPYARRALEDEVVKVRAAPPGQRNETLNESAFILGGFVGGGLLPQALVEQHLHAAIQSWPGVEPAKRERDAKTLLRAVTEGMTQPRSLPPPPEPRGKMPPLRSATPASRNDDVSRQARTAQGSAARSLWSQRSRVAPDAPSGLFLTRHGCDPAQPWPMFGGVELPYLRDQQRGPCIAAALLRWSADAVRDVAAVYCTWLGPDGAPLRCRDPSSGTLIVQQRLIGDATGAVVPLTPLPPDRDRLLLVVGLGAALRLKRAVPTRPLWIALNVTHAGHAVLPTHLSDVTLVVPEETPVAQEQWAIQRLAAAGRDVRVARQAAAQGRVA